MTWRGSAGVVGEVPLSGSITSLSSRQHRAPGATHDLLRDAAEHRAREAGAPVRAHHDHVEMAKLGEIDNLVRRAADADAAPHLLDALLVEARHQLLHLRTRR